MRFWHLMLVAGSAALLTTGAAQAGGSSHKAKKHTEAAPAAENAPADASAIITKPGDNGRTLVTHAPIPDTPENRALHGGPKSQAGRNTKPKGN